MKTITALLATLLFLGSAQNGYATMLRGSGKDQQNELSASYKKEKAAKIAKSKNTSKPKKSKTSTNVEFATGQVSVSPAKQYQILDMRKSNITAEIEAINLSLPELKRPKAKKALQRIQKLELELNSVTKSMSLFPKSITEPGYSQQVENEQKQAFMDALNRKTDLMIAQNDPFAEQISLDPELEKTYRNYINDGGAVSFGSSDFSTDKNSNDMNQLISQNGGRFYSVLFAIASKPISTKNYPYTTVYTQKLKNGTIAYFAGSFENQQQANVVCNQILAKGQFRDAFVVLVK